MRFPIVFFVVTGMATSAMAQAQQAPLPSTPGYVSTRKPLQPAPSKEQQAAKDAAVAAPKCSQYDKARNAVYAAAIRGILSEMPQPGQGMDPAQMQSSVEATYAKYESEAKAGDIASLRKLAAIELFVMQLRKKDADEPTLRKLCALGKLQDRQRQILDPLACAVLSLEGSRRNEEAHRSQAKTMMANAKALLPEGANASHAGKLLYDDVAKGLEGCY